MARLNISDPKLKLLSLISKMCDKLVSLYPIKVMSLKKVVQGPLLKIQNLEKSAH